METEEGDWEHNPAIFVNIAVLHTTQSIRTRFLNFLIAANWRRRRRRRRRRSLGSGTLWAAFICI